MILGISHCSLSARGACVAEKEWVLKGVLFFAFMIELQAKKDRGCQRGVALSPLACFKNCDMLVELCLKGNPHLHSDVLSSSALNPW